MRVSIIAILILVAACLGPLTTRPATAAPVVIEDCLVSLIEEAQVPAQESGELMAVMARDGQQVSAGEVLARIDDKLAKLEIQVRKTELVVAEKKAKDMVSIDYAKAALEAIKGTKMAVQQYLLEYMLIDEEKHNKILDNLEAVKKGMYPYA